MSAAARRWLDRQRVEDGTLLMVLRVLADAADTHGLCNQSQNRIATTAGLSERAVRGSVAILERSGMITRRRRSKGGRDGRVADLVQLAIDRSFKVTRADVSTLRKSGASEFVTGTESRLPLHLLPAQSAVAPSPSRVEEVIIPSPETSKTRVSGRVWQEGKHGQWRARVRLDGVDMNLGRFPTDAEATRALDRALADIEHAASHRTGAPPQSACNASPEALDGDALTVFLFGCGRN